jgi:hypothetical protein
MNHHMVFECDAYEYVSTQYQTLFQRQRVDECCRPPSEFAPVGRSMAAFMCQDVHQIATFIHECLLAHSKCILGVDAVVLLEFSVSFILKCIRMLSSCRLFLQVVLQLVILSLMAG